MNLKDYEDKEDDLLASLQKELKEMRAKRLRCENNYRKKSITFWANLTLDNIR